MQNMWNKPFLNAKVDAPYFAFLFPLHYVRWVLSSVWHTVTSCRASRNTAPRAPRTPHAPRWNIVKTSRRLCLGFNWISRKISRKRWISEGENWRRGKTSTYPPCTSTCSTVCTVQCFVTSTSCITTASTTTYYTSVCVHVVSHLTAAISCHADISGMLAEYD